MEGILSLTVNSAMLEIDVDDAVRVVVVRMSGVDTESDLAARFAQYLRQLPQPIIAMVDGSRLDASSAILEACDIVIEGQDSEGQAQQLARDLAAKDPLALRFTKKTLQDVANVGWDDILAYTTAQQQEIKALQAGRPSARAQAIESFLEGKLKPGATS